MIHGRVFQKPSYVRPFAHCEYENGYLVYDRFDGRKEVWRLASDCAVDEVGATCAPPDEQQKRACAFSLLAHSRYAPRGHFRPWAKLSFPEVTRAYRLAYPTLLCANREHAYLHDVRTGALVQTIDIAVQNVCYVDVNERYVFVCELVALHVYSRGDGGTEVLRIPRDVSFSKAVGPSSTVVDRESFVSVLPLLPVIDEHPSEFIAGECVAPLLLSNDLPSFFLLAHVSRDGRDLVVMTAQNHVILVRDFERVCREETRIEASGVVVHLSDQAECFYLAFEHGRVCVATVRSQSIISSRRAHSLTFLFYLSVPWALHIRRRRKPERFD